jgi:hypothetical protein
MGPSPGFAGPANEFVALGVECERPVANRPALRHLGEG